MSNYCELHGHSEWSLLDGVASRVKHAERAAALGHPALAMTEHEVLSGTVHHIDACRASGIMPIVGLEAYYRERRITTSEVQSRKKRGEDVSQFWEYFHMVILAKNVRGWRSLMLLSSESFRSGGYRKHCVDDELLDKYNEGLIISTSCVSGFIPRAILRGDDGAVKRHCEKLDRWVGDDWYWELQPHDFDDLRAVNLEIPRLAAAYGKPVVATRDAHAPDESWVDTQHVSVKIRTKGSMVSEPVKEADADEKYDMTIAGTAIIAPAEQTRADFLRYHPNLDARVVDQAIAGTGEIADRVVPWVMDRSPKMPRYRDTLEEEYDELRQRVHAGLRELGHDQDQRYLDGVEKELAIYRKRGFCAFFLIVDDMLRWLRSTDGLPPCEWDPDPAPSKKPEKVGLGRGSAGACRTAYALRITLINPVTYDLLFERFLNEDRGDSPDIDIDLTEEGERLAKEWLKRTRGRDKVYDMIAHGTLGARGALRRVAMVYDVPFEEINPIAKLIPDDDVKSDLTLEQIRDHVPEVARYAERHPAAFEHAARLQGSRATLSEHACAIVVSERPLEQMMPVMKKSAKDDYLVTAFGDASDKPVSSSLGFFKLDLLRVVQLRKQAYAEELIRQVHGVDVDLDLLPALEDPYAVDAKAMQVFCLGLKLGIFQWDGKSPMASLTKRIKPKNILQLAAANAIIRPGVSAHSESYVERSNGAEFEYWDDAVEPALRETFGLPIFQEQIMAVFQHLGGYSARESDDVRRIMAKYYRQKGDAARRMLGEYQERFTDSAASICRGGRPMAEQIWHFCGNACEYLFNRIHALEYGLTAYGDAWLKGNYPDAFYAALMTFPPSWVKKPEQRNSFYERAVREARAVGIEVLPPDVNESQESFFITAEGGLRWGLKGLKGLGPAMVADVINNRPFVSLEDMEVRLTACNRAGRQALGAAGALDRFDARRNLSPEERADAEEERIGIALSGEDKLAGIRDELREIIHTQDEVEAAPNGAALVVGGEIVDGREGKTKYGPSLKLTIAFGADEYLVSMSPRDYKKCKAELKELIASDEPVVVRGSRDVEWDCVAIDEIKAAAEVLDMMKKTPVAA